jgi:type II secretion system protein H
MPTSATGKARNSVRAHARAHRAAPGFTLLELLVVIVIVGIITAMATLNIGIATRDRGSQKEMERLAELLKTASEEAQMHGREFGLNFYAHQYEVIAFEPDRETWVPLTDEDPFRPHKLAESGVADLEVQGRIVRLAEEPPARVVAKDAPADNAPKGAATAARDKEKTSTGKDKPPTEKKDPGTPPQILILSSGDITPFVFRYRSAIGEPAVRLVVTDNGDINTVRDEL